MSEEDGAEKSYEPSQKKLDDARKRGEVPKSTDLATAAGYGGLILAAMAFGAGSITQMGGTMVALIDRPEALAPLFMEGGAGAPGQLILELAGPILPWFAVPAALVLLSFIAQRALVFAPEKLAPKLNRISPIETAKQKFGRAGLFEFLKSFVKLAIYSLVLGLYLWAQLPRMLTTMQLEPQQIGAELADLTLGLLFIVLLVSAVIGIVDALFQHAEHLRKNRMTRKEMTDEMKESEGDPYMKQQRRNRAIELATGQMLADVPEASVVVVNPTHYAVALKWDRGAPGAPVCVAKGVDEIAARIRERAMEHGVPIHSDPPTARALYADVKIGEEIRPEHYQAVAAAIRFAERIRRKARGW